MSDGEVKRPFRWDVTRRSQLGSLPDVDPPETYDGFEDDLLRLGRASAPVALVDVVDTGETFERLLTHLERWTEREGAEWRAVARTLRIVGLTRREHTSPTT
jgi:hypothetical protein